MFAFKKFGAGLCVSLATLLSTPSLSIAQETKGNATVSGWFKTCDEQGSNKICNVQYRVVANNGSIITLVNLIQFSGEVSRGIFQIVVPTARSLPQGIQVKVDGKKATSIPYGFCRPKICGAEAQLNDSLVKVLKAGGRLDITSLNYQGTPNNVPVSLKGFTAAFDGPPLKKKDDITENKEELKKQLEEKLNAQ